PVLQAVRHGDGGGPSPVEAGGLQALRPPRDRTVRSGPRPVRQRLAGLPARGRIRRGGRRAAAVASGRLGRAGTGGAVRPERAEGLPGLNENNAREGATNPCDTENSAVPA